MKNTEKTFKVTQMFNVTCSISGASVKVRKPVYLARLGKVQKLVRSATGKAITTAEAIEVLNTHYVSIAARKANNVNMLGYADGAGLPVLAKQTRHIEKSETAVTAPTEVVAPEVTAAS